MPLSPGTRIGNYEILASLGAGGMGEVYRARDTRLERSVAIKSLPAGVSGSAERLARFEREARLLASLDHPNVARIHGLEDVGGVPHLVLEFVEGETLAGRLTRGPLGVHETLQVCTQIASAVEAAHERGIVHRDLKPGNVMLTPARAVKVLDFGLAKGAPPESRSAADLSASPTALMTATGEGVILGTASYMSPEQARGLEVDRRADVWAFGCVLYECLTGRLAFSGETASDVIARVIEREPDWRQVPASTPARLVSLARRCLTKDPAARPRDMGDLRRELEAITLERSSPESEPPSPSLAVLYFENLAKDPDSEYFCAGITEDILTDLSKIRGLRVASRNAVARYRGAPADLPKVAAELGVGAVLEGSVRRAGDRVRISAQLVNAADGFQLWAERYDRTLEDVFAVQGEIASSIAQALRVALTPAESETLVRDRPRDVHAYDLYLKAREHYNRYSLDAMRSALELFQQAIAVDPDYALAWAGVGDCYGQMCQLEAEDDREDLIRRGLEAAEKAIALSPRLAEGYKAQALVLRFAGDLEGSRAANARALEANPRFTPALINLAVDAYCLGDLARAERLVRRAIEVDPQEAFAILWLAAIAVETRRFDEARSLTRRLRELSDNPFYVSMSHAILLRARLKQGDLEAVERSRREALEDGALPPMMRCYEAVIAARSGRPDDARRLLGDLAGDESSLAGHGLLAAAEAATRIGELEIARRFLDHNIVRDLTPVTVRLEPALHPLLDHEPFAPRRSDMALVWPLEAPMIDASAHALFREVRIESGRAEGSDVLGRQ